MYYHPRMFDWANAERMLAACRAAFARCARSRRPRHETVLASVRMIAEAKKAAPLAAWLLFCRTPRTAAVRSRAERLDRWR